MRRAASLAAIAVGALMLTVASSWIERFGPDQAVYCALGKSADGHEIWCPEPVLNGGWPAPYLYDNPGISVERQLSFFEDSFRTAPFVADSAFFALLLLIVSRLLSGYSGLLGRPGRAGPQAARRPPLN